MRLKVERAYDQLSALDNLFSEYMEAHPYELRHEVKAGGAKHFCRLQLSEPIPVVWSVMFGEMIHNLRSALDQCVSLLTIDRIGKELRESAFPLYRRREDFYKTESGPDQIRHLGFGPRALITMLQPFSRHHSRSGMRSWRNALAALNDFWNQDKHRMVHLWGFTCRDPQPILISPEGISCVFKPSRRLLQDNSIVLTVLCDPPSSVIELGGSYSFGIGVRSPKKPLTKKAAAVGNPKRRPSLGVSLEELYNFSAATVSALLSAIGRQDKVIGFLSFYTGPHPVFGRASETT